MKILLVLFLLFISSAGAAQSKKQEPFKSVYELLKRKTITEKVAYQHLLPMKEVPPTKYYTTKIIRLPLDNTPCLLLSAKGFNMPVLQLSPAGTMPVQ